MSIIVVGGIIGGVIGLLTVVIMFFLKEQRYNKLLKSVKEPVDYSGLYHYASFKRFQKGTKFFDSYGILYLSGHMLYYKTNEGVAPMTFDLKECSVQMEPDWRWLKWFSVTTPAGEKFYFDSHKMGAFKNNSDETLKGYQAIKSRSAA
jgi:hypothetical protein